ncbi:MAG: putative transcriptional regulator [Sulfitobacter sp.]|jgi:putative transcriptional regulator
MNVQQSPDSLKGQILIAMPGMSDPRFDHSVIYLCAHSDEGAMGLILNKPASDLDLTSLMEQIGIKPTDKMRKMPVRFGGPVEHGRGFVLHSADYSNNDSTLQVNDAFGMTATLDILEDIAKGGGPDTCLLALGYAGWGPGQLEQELQANGWLTGDVGPELIFDPNVEGMWSQALHGIGIDPSMLSSVGGRA